MVQSGNSQEGLRMERNVIHSLSNSSLDEEDCPRDQEKKKRMQKIIEYKSVNINGEHFIQLRNNHYGAAMKRGKKTQSYFLNIRKVSSKLKDVEKVIYSRKS